MGNPPLVVLLAQRRFQPRKRFSALEKSWRSPNRQRRRGCWMISVTAAAGLGGSMVLREFDANGVPVPGAGLQSREGDRDRDPVQCPDRRRGYSARRNVEFGVG